MAKAKDKEQVSIQVKVAGTIYSLQANDVRPLDVAALRRATGFSFMGLMKAAETDPDIDVVAAIVWLSRRTNGERTLAYETVAGEFDYDTEIEQVASKEELEAPEA